MQFIKAKTVIQCPNGFLTTSNHTPWGGVWSAKKNLLRLMFYWCFFSFLFLFSVRDHRGPSAYRPETLPHIGSVFNFIIAVNKFGGPSLKKIGGQKRTKFGAISDHFRLRSRTPPERMETFKIRKTWSTAIPPVFGEKIPVNFGPLTTTLDVSLDPPKSTFSEYHILAPIGCRPSNFCTR